LFFKIVNTGISNDVTWTT